MTVLFTHIKQLVNTQPGNTPLKGASMADLPVIENAFLLVEGERIAKFGAMHDLELLVPELPGNVVDLSGKFVLPSWCDSHTHLVFAGSRETE
ncbi:MAG: imidazolonepropionase, partial [Chitinophagaceae bacterium]